MFEPSEARRDSVGGRFGPQPECEIFRLNLKSLEVVERQLPKFGHQESSLWPPARTASYSL